MTLVAFLLMVLPLALTDRPPLPHSAAHLRHPLPHPVSPLRSLLSKLRLRPLNAARTNQVRSRAARPVKVARPARAKPVKIQKAQRTPIKFLPPKRPEQLRREALSSEEFLQAQQVPGFQTNQHEAIRKQEGTQIFEGWYPEVMHYVPPPKIKSTDDFASRIEARSARANAPIGQDVILGKGLVRKPDGVISSIKIYEVTR